MKALKKNPGGKLRTVQSVMADVNMSRNTAMKIAEDAHAVFRYGAKIVRIDFEKFMQFLEENTNATP